MHHSNFHNPSVLNGTALIASGAIGAGMFSLPIVSAGMWFGWTLLSLCVVWLINLWATLLLLEANLQYPGGSSFDTLVRGTLGRKWNVLNNLSIMFIMYILLYAFFSASGSIIIQTISSIFEHDYGIAQNSASLIFGLLVALLVWSGASAVSRICKILLAGMVITFLLSTGGLLVEVNPAQLFQWTDKGTSLAPFIWAALPYFVTSFACAGLVPSLVKYYQHRHEKVRLSIIYGTLISLLIYLLWVAAAFSGLDRQSFVPVIQGGGNIGDLVAALESAGEESKMKTMLNLFSNFAIVTSFLSIGLGLFDFFADRFKLNEGLLDRTKSAALTFIPPATLSYFLPNGFISAIGYAGLVVLFSFYIVPVAMAFKHRVDETEFEYKMAGGNLSLYLVSGFAVIIMLLKVLGMQNLLPVFG